MMGLRWAAEQCPTARFYFFVDDDYYISTRNVLRFLRNPVNYPAYLEDPVVSFDDEADTRHQGKDSVSPIGFIGFKMYRMKLATETRSKSNYDGE